MYKRQELASSLNIQEETTDFVEDTVSALLGDPVAAGKLICTLAKSPFFLREKLFWRKFERFLCGIEMDKNERDKFCEKLTEKGCKKDNSYRLIQAIDQAETQQKIDFLINASRALSMGLVNLATYFRICHVITNTIEEDLIFLSEHIKNEGDFGYSDTCLLYTSRCV